MEEKIYGRQVNKESLAGRLVDAHQIERYTSTEEESLYDTTTLWSSLEHRPQIAFPEDDKLLASILLEHDEKIWSLHKHDALLQHKVDEELSEEEIKLAWATFEREEELNRILPKALQNKVLKTLFPLTRSEDGKTDKSKTESFFVNSKMSRERHRPRVEKILWQKRKGWKGSICIGVPYELKVECEMFISESPKEAEKNSSIINLTHTLEVRFVPRQALENIPRDGKSTMCAIDLGQRAPKGSLAFMTTRLKSKVAVVALERQSILISHVEDTLLVGVFSSAIDLTSYKSLVSYTAHPAAVDTGQWVAPEVQILHPVQASTANSNLGPCWPFPSSHSSSDSRCLLDHPYKVQTLLLQ